MNNESSSQNKRTVKCPHCGKPAIYSPENPSRPFCSQRCRQIDLGSWADESYRIPASTASSDSLSSSLDEDSDEDYS